MREGKARTRMGMIIRTNLCYNERLFSLRVKVVIPMNFPYLCVYRIDSIRGHSKNDIAGTFMLAVIYADN